MKGEKNKKVVPQTEQQLKDTLQTMLNIIKKYKDENYFGMKTALQLRYNELNWKILSSYLLYLANEGHIRVVYCKKRVEFFELIED